MVEGSEVESADRDIRITEIPVGHGSTSFAEMSCRIANSWKSIKGQAS
jgi:hypothetical protein